MTVRGLIATGLGIGHIPFAPGTFGSVWGVALVWALHRGGGNLAVAAGVVVTTLVGLWAAADPLRRFGRVDPGFVVIDEVAGQMLALLFVVPSMATLLASFALFRLFDIAKPYPIGRLEGLPGSSGIMADDMLAGIYANLVLQGLVWAFPAWWGVS